MQKLSLRKSFLVLFGVLLLLNFSAISSVQGAASTGAKIELSSDSFLVDSLVTIRVYDITASGSSSNLYFSYDLTGTDTLEAKTEYANITIHLGSNEDEWVFSMIFPAPTAGGYTRVHVANNATGRTVDLASDTMYAQEFDDIWPDELIITVGISLMVVLIVVGIVIGLASLGASKLRN